MLGAVFVVGADLWSPELAFLKSSNLIAYLAFIVAASLVTITGIPFIAMRRAEFRFLQSVLMGLRVLLLFPLIFLGALGIFGAFGLSFIVTLAVSLLLLSKLGVEFTIKIDKEFFCSSA